MIEHNICQHCHEPIRKAHSQSYYIHDNGFKNVCDLPYHGKFYFAEPLKIEYVEVIKICESVKRSNTTDIAHKLWNLAIDEVTGKIKSLQGSPEPQTEKCGNIFSYKYNTKDGVRVVELVCQKPKGHDGKHEANGSDWS
jgi:hypothetical protein